MNINLKWLRDKLKSQNIQGMIVSNPLNIKYLTRNRSRRNTFTYNEG